MGGRCAWCARPAGRFPALPDLGIHREALRLWVRQDEADRGQRDDRLTSDERAELGRLRAENSELRRANEILKAASALFAEERDCPRTK